MFFWCLFRITFRNLMKPSHTKAFASDAAAALPFKLLAGAESCGWSRRQTPPISLLSQRILLFLHCISMINILSNVQKVWFPWYLRTLYIDWNTSMYEILDSNWLKKWMQIAQGYFSQGLSAIGWSSNCKMHWLPLAPSFQRALHFPSLWPPTNGRIWKLGW